MATGGVTGNGRHRGDGRRDRGPAGVATGGVTGTGGIVATGGVTGTGGIVATGGVTGTGGIVATGGVTGTGGLPGTGGAAGSSGAKNCVDAIKLAGYSAGGADVQRLQGKRRRQVGELHEGHRLPRHELSLRVGQELRPSVQQHRGARTASSSACVNALLSAGTASSRSASDKAPSVCVIASAACATDGCARNFRRHEKDPCSVVALRRSRFVSSAAWRAPTSTCRGRARSPRSCRRSG